MSESGEVTGRGRAGVVDQGGHSVLMGGPLGAILLAGSETTGGSVSFLIHTLAPRALGSMTHTHRREDEWSYILEGQIGVQLDEQTWVTKPGDLVLKPRGVPHAFWNAGDEPARMLEVVTPSGFEGYFTRLGEILGAGPEPDMEALAAIAAKYELDVDLASIPRLAQEHGLRLG